MATYRKCTLPALKVTQRPTNRPKSTTLVHRSMSNSSASAECLDPRPSDPSSEVQESLPPLVDMVPDFIEPTEHELSRQSSAAGWNEIRNALRTAVTENAAMPQGQLCIMCAEVACLQCQRCGPQGFFCSQCFPKFHSKVNIFHIPEKWEVRIISDVSHFIKADIDETQNLANIAVPISITAVT